jgi:hypothetical protein
MEMPRTSREHRQKFGKFWRPRTAVCESMCSSCPFGREDNLAAKVAELGCEDTSPIVTKADAENAAEAGIEFMCHSTLIHDREAQVTITPPSAKVCKGLFMYRRGEI